MRRDRWWTAFLALGALAVAVFAAGCGDDDDDGGPSGSSGGVETLTEGELLVGTDTPYEPFEIGQPPEISGYDIDVMSAIAEELGLEPVYQDTGFATIFRDVAAGQFDTVAAASTILEAREERVDFTDPYYLTQQVLLVTDDSDIASTEDLSGAIVGAQDGTTGEEYANDETEAGEVRGFPEGPDAIAAVTTGQVDAAIIDQPVAVDAVEKAGGIEVAAEIPTNELYGIAISKDNPGLLEGVNGALVAMKEEGFFDDLYEQYFQSTPPDSVINGTTTNPG